MGWTKRHGIMLCQPLDDRNLARNFQSFPKMLAQPKLDGMRCWVSWEDGEPTLWSSEGNIFHSVPHIELALKELLPISGPLQFDGELYTHNLPFEQIVSIGKRKEANLHDDCWDLCYHIFDYKGSETQADRYITLARLKEKWELEASPQCLPVLQWVPTFVIQRHEVETYLERFVGQGYEGIILRNPTTPYVEKRPWTMLKWKPSRKDWYQIVAFGEAISEDGIPLGRLGFLTCRDRYGNEFNVGPGLGISHEKARELWQAGLSIIGKYAEVYYQNLTKTGVPRFGKFSLIVDATNISGESH